MAAAQIAALVVVAFIIAVPPSGGKPHESTYAEPPCHNLSDKVLQFSPNETRLLGLYCAASHGENFQQTMARNASHVWFGMIIFGPPCKVCCARGNGSGSIFYSVTKSGPQKICNQEKRKTHPKKKTLPKKNN
ncbi:uncharacterized protein LOC144105502 [Amblyomma americanum]